MGFGIISGLYMCLIGVKWSQYATYFHLGPIQGLYEEDMLVIYHDFEGNLPFTGILQEVYGLPYATSTKELAQGPSESALVSIGNRDNVMESQHFLPPSK